MLEGLAGAAAHGCAGLCPAASQRRAGALRGAQRRGRDGDVVRDGGFLGTAPAAAGDRVLIATLKGEVLELAPASGKVVRKHAVGAPVRSQPVAVDGWIYVGTEDGRLVAIDTKDAALTGWPMWGGNAARTGVAAK